MPDEREIPRAFSEAFHGEDGEHEVSFEHLLANLREGYRRTVEEDDGAEPDIVVILEGVHHLRFSSNGLRNDEMLWLAQKFSHSLLCENEEAV